MSTGKDQCNQLCLLLSNYKSHELIYQDKKVDKGTVKTLTMSNYCKWVTEKRQCDFERLWFRVTPMPYIWICSFFSPCHPWVFYTCTDCLVVTPLAGNPPYSLEQWSYEYTSRHNPLTFNFISPSRCTFHHIKALLEFMDMCFVLDIV